MAEAKESIASRYINYMAEAARERNILRTVNKMTEAQESNILRIVNIDETLTEPTLKNLIQTLIQPKGNIEKVYIKKDDKLQIIYAYLVFEYSYDAVKASESLNGYTHNVHKFEVALIGPGLEYKKYITPSSRFMLQSSLLMKRRQELPTLGWLRSRNNTILQQRMFGIKNDVKPVVSKISSTNSSKNTVLTPGAYVPPTLRNRLRNNTILQQRMSGIKNDVKPVVSTISSPNSSKNTVVTPGAYVPPTLRNGLHNLQI